IKGFECSYQVSNIGRVRSLNRSVGGKNGTKKQLIGKIRKQDNFSNYYGVVLSNDTIIKRSYTHRLVAEAFIPNPENKPQVNHIDGNKENNNVENLEWATSSENNNHAYKNGLRKKRVGEKNHLSK